MPKAPEPTAAETYAAHRSDIARLLDVLDMELDKHGERAKADPRHWGLVGDLAKVREDLVEAVRYLSGTETTDVERFLSDATGTHHAPTETTMTNPDTNPKPSLDAMGKQAALDAAMEHARQALLLETLETRGRDALDFHEIPVSAIRDLVRHAFESGYRSGLHAGYRQGRSDACDEARGKEARTQPRNPDLVDRSTTDPTP